MYTDLLTHARVLRGDRYVIGSNLKHGEIVHAIRVYDRARRREREPRRSSVYYVRQGGGVRQACRNRIPIDFLAA
jgi:hypothetical protein